MLLKTGQEFQCLIGWGQNTNVLTDRAGIPVFIKTGQEFLCLKGQGYNANV